MYHFIPDTGCLHLSCMLFRALLCVSSPVATISFRWLSCALMTSSAVFPWNGHHMVHPFVYMSLSSWSSPPVSSGFSGGLSPQLTALFTSAPILASSAAVNSVRAKAVGRMAPSSRFASSLKPNVAYLVLNFWAPGRSTRPCRPWRTRASRTRVSARAPARSP